MPDCDSQSSKICKSNSNQIALHVRGTGYNIFLGTGETVLIENVFDSVLYGSSSFADQIRRVATAFILEAQHVHRVSD